MKIQSQREAFAYRFAADENGLDFDWAKHPTRSRSYTAQLENGDHLSAYGYGGDNSLWGYMLYGPKTRSKTDPNLPDGDKTYHSYTDEPDLHSELLASFMDDGGSRLPHPDPHSAMRAAETHYKSLNRRGAAPSSGIDYSDLNKFLDES